MKAKLQLNVPEALREELLALLKHARWETTQRCRHKVEDHCGCAARQRLFDPLIRQLRRSG